MKLKQVTYASLANLGNYENEKIELTAEIEPGDDWKAVLDYLKGKVHAQLNNEDEYWKTQDKFRQAKRDLEELHEQINKAKTNYEIVKVFMTAQGLRTDMPQFPSLPQLPAAPEEVIEGEPF